MNHTQTEQYGEINNVTMYASYDNNDGYCFYQSGSALVTKCAVDGDVSVDGTSWYRFKLTIGENGV